MLEEKVINEGKTEWILDGNDREPYETQRMIGEYLEWLLIIILINFRVGVQREIKGNTSKVKRHVIKMLDSPFTQGSVNVNPHYTWKDNPNFVDVWRMGLSYIGVSSCCYTNAPLEKWR